MLGREQAGLGFISPSLTLEGLSGPGLGWGNQQGTKEESKKTVCRVRYDYYKEITSKLNVTKVGRTRTAASRLSFLLYVKIIFRGVTIG